MTKVYKYILEAYNLTQCASRKNEVKIVVRAVSEKKAQEKSAKLIDREYYEVKEIYGL